VVDRRRQAKKNQPQKNQPKKNPASRAPRPENRTPRVGRRPSRPGLLFAVAAMWIVVGVFVFVTFTASWKLIPAAVSVGIGALYLRGALATVARRSER
jgi:hypothetical protein